MQFRSRPRPHALACALVLAGLMALPMSAAAQKGVRTPSKVPGAGKLDPTNLNVRATSWNGRPAPRNGWSRSNQQTNPRFRSRSRDPMAIHVEDAHPGTEVRFSRQKRSADVKVPSKVRDVAQLRGLAEKAAQYVEMHRFTTTNTSRNEMHAELVTEPNKVAWPNSRVLVEAKTRDGQKAAPQPLVVDGLRTQSVSPLSARTLQPENIEVSGQLLPSARAWIKHENVFVSEPSYNRALVREGKADVTRAKRMESRAKRLETLMNKESAKQSADHEKINQWSTEIQQLRNQAPTLRAQGEEKIARGEKLMVTVVAPGGVPASADVTTMNRREAGEGDSGTVHTAWSQSEAVHGFLVHEVEALRGDELSMTVEFGQRGNSLTSRAELRFNVPTTRERAAFEMGGIKYYRVSPTFNRATHDPDPIQPE